MAESWQLKAVLSANSTSMVAALGNVNKMAAGTRKYLTDVASSAGKIGTSLGLPITALSGILGGFSAVAIKNAMVGLTDMEDNLSKVSAATGLAAGEIKRMQYVAQVSNVPFESLVESTGKLNKNIHDAASGKNKNLAALFHRLGISTKDANGELRSASDMLPQLADAFKRNENPATRAAMGMAIYGKSWQNMIPLLADGAQKLAERNARFKELGLEVSDEKAYEKKLQAISKFGDKLDDLTFVSKGFQNTIATELIPVIEPLLTDLIKWIVANKELIATQVKQYVKDFATYLKAIDWDQVIKGIKAFGSGMGYFVDMIGGTKNALIGLVIIMNAQTIMAIAGLIGALGRAGLAFVGMAAKAYLAGNASLLSMLRVATVALFTAGPIGVLGAAFAWLGGIAAGAGGLISGAMGVVAVAIRGVGAAMMANPLGIIIGIATAAYLIYKNWGTLKEWFSTFFDWVGDKFKSMLGWVADVAKSVGQFFGMGASATDVAGAATAGKQQAPYPLPGDNLGSGRPPLINQPQAQQSGGKYTFEFLNPPPGMRLVDQQTRGPAQIDMSTGPRGYATGMP